MIWLFWIIMLIAIGSIAYYMKRAFVAKNSQERILKILGLVVMATMAALIVAGGFRYYAMMPEPHNITESTPLSQRLKVAASLHASADQIKRLAQDSNREVRYVLATNPSIGEGIAEQLLEDSDAAIRKRIARHPGTPLSLLEEQIKKETDATVKLVLADAIRYRTEEGYSTAAGGEIETDPHLRIIEAQEMLPENSADAEKIRRAISSKPFMYSIDSFANDPNPDIRYAAASNPLASSQVLNELMNDADEGVRMMAIITLARKEGTSSNFLETYGGHSNSYVRRAIAANPETPSPMLQQLSQDKVLAVVEQVAENKQTPISILASLSKSKHPDVRRRVARHPMSSDNVLRNLIDDEDDEVRRRVAQNPNTHLSLLARLGNDDSEAVRLATAMNPNSDAETLARLAEDTSHSVRAAVAENAKTSVQLVKTLSADAHPEVRASADRNLRNLSRTLKTLEKEGDEFVRRQVAQNANTPPEMLDKLAKDVDPHVRERVALNPNTLPETLKELLRDSEPHVRWAAEKNPNKL